MYSLCDDITYRAAAKAGVPATSSAILGPFWREPIKRENGTTISFNTPADGQIAYFYGKVVDSETGLPLQNATVDVWQASTNGTPPYQTGAENVLTLVVGLYEQQDPDQVDHNLRGLFTTDAEGKYGFYCLLPTPYPVSRSSLEE